MPRKSAQPATRDPEDAAARRRNNEDWDERLRRVGDARFIEVAWSGRDAPYWPLPKE